MTLRTDLDLAEQRARDLLGRDDATSVAEAARRVGMNRRTLSDRLAKSPIAQQEPAEKVENEDGSLSTNSPPAESPWTPEDVLREHGIEPEDVQIISVRASRWGPLNAPNHQLRVNAVRNSALIAPASLAEWEAPPAPPAPECGDKNIVVCGDHHAPHHDKGLHQCFLSYLNDERPRVGIALGDSADYSDISRHRNRPGFAQTVNECNDAVGGMLRDYREASPDTYWYILPGNHDFRLEALQADYAPGASLVRPAELDGPEIPSYDLRRLWHLEKLGFHMVEGDWDQTKINLTDSLSARHGYMTSENTGKQMLNKHSRSQLQGHSHRMRFTYRTRHDPIDTRVAIECATMAEIKDGLGYADEPDWQQGFVHGYLWEDGDFALAPAIYTHGRLLLPDGRRYRTEDS